MFIKNDVTGDLQAVIEIRSDSYTYNRISYYGLDSDEQHVRLVRIHEERFDLRSDRDKRFKELAEKLKP